MQLTDPITPFTDRELSTFHQDHQNHQIVTPKPIDILQPNAPTQQRLINLPLQTTTRPITLLRARNYRL
jgi:hypothetical protein